ncbi:MAG: hypothetical protein WDO71_03065 [Bacteroidota bacterium]
MNGYAEIIKSVLCNYYLTCTAGQSWPDGRAILPIAVIMIAFLVLAGWQFDIKELTIHCGAGSYEPPYCCMLYFFRHFNVAYCFICSDKEKDSNSPLSCRHILLAGLVKLTSLFIHFNWQPDQLLFSNKLEKILQAMNPQYGTQYSFLFYAYRYSTMFISYRNSWKKGYQRNTWR